MADDTLLAAVFRRFMATPTCMIWLPFGPDGERGSAVLDGTVDITEEEAAAIDRAAEARDAVADA